MGFQIKTKYRIINVLYIIPVLILFSSFIGYTQNNVQLIDPNKNFVSEDYSAGFFELATKKGTTPIVCSSSDFSGVNKVVNVFASDIERVCSQKPHISFDVLPKSDRLIIIGTLGKNTWIDSLANQNKIDKKLIAGKWEASLIQVIQNPFEGVKEALVIVGSDKRGTLYAMFEVSEQMGVSPWYWWADVPVKTKESIFIKPGIYTQGEPAVKYRGIFINDEAPALAGWVYEKYGEFNSEFYYQVFELILRLKGNYLWPAMWGRAFNFNDTLNPVLADEMGIVMGTSHHEPMLRAQQEWKMFGKGAWNYDKNQQVLDSFWAEGIKNMKDHESIITIGMRGDGDEPMSEENNIELLEKIVKNQRQMIEEITQKPATQQPQIWALYKEVQDYYDHGMRVPNDVTLLLCDDNWGNVRKLPNADEQKHPGGYGMYYHFDYVGGPRNYKWLNVTQIERVWEQMNLTFSHGVDEIWIVNVGDIKPMELPISFFLEYAWNPKKWPLEKLPNYTTIWAQQQFGSKQAKEIAQLLDAYTKFNARRTPEMLSSETYSLTNYREFETVVRQYNLLVDRVEKIKQELDSTYQDAFFQLVEYPIKACANLNELYYTVALNRWYATQNRLQTNAMADKAIAFFEKDALLAYEYNNVLAKGKWHHMMDQTHIGYTYWQQPEQNSMPKVERTTHTKDAKMAIALEGSSASWPNDKLKSQLPEFSPFSQKSYYVEVFNQGTMAFNCSLKSTNDFIKLSVSEVLIESQKRIEISIDWDKAPIGKSESIISIESTTQQKLEVLVKVFNPQHNEINDFAVANGIVVFEAEQYEKAHNTSEITWKVIPNLGKTLSGIKTFPANHSSIEISDASPYLEYSFHSFDTGWVDIHAIFSPTLDYLNKGGFEFGLALNTEKVQCINMHNQAISSDWNSWVGNHSIETITKHYIDKVGTQTLKYYVKDAGVVLQKLIVNQGGLKPNYLGAMKN